MTAVFLAAPQRLVDITIDGKAVRVPEGVTLLEAWRTSLQSTCAGCAWWRSKGHGRWYLPARGRPSPA
jgi:hypothetical protein